MASAAERDDIETLSAREIKEQLAAARVEYTDCFEKADLVRRLRKYRQMLEEDKVQVPTSVWLARACTWSPGQIVFPDEHCSSMS